MGDMKEKTIAVLTSGGDAPGMNAAVRAVVRTALERNINVKGIRRGYNGLLHGDVEGNVFDMNLRSVSGIIQRGGTVLYTARCDEFMDINNVKRAAEFCHRVGIDGVVVIGGDGSFRGARDLSNNGVNCVGIPGTIDNDIACSDYTIGFDTAVNTAIDMVDKIRDTTQSHDRCSVVEVMGRRCGDLAVMTGIACGACSIIIPEVDDFDFDRDIRQRIQNSRNSGKEHFIIVVAEGVFMKGKDKKSDGHLYSQNIPTSEKLAEIIEREMKITTRHTVLGHVQRGGSPSARDRVLASSMGYHAVDLLDKGLGNRVVVCNNDRIVDYDITEALNMPRKFNKALYEMALTISI